MVAGHQVRGHQPNMIMECRTLVVMEITISLLICYRESLHIPLKDLIYPRKFRKKIGVIGNKDSLGSKVNGAPKYKVMFVHHVANDTDDNAMKAYIEQNMCKVQSFEKASNPALLAKSFRFKVLVDNSKKMFDVTVWPSGIGCNYWKFKKS